MGKIVAIGNQKGGVGKSTITSFIANYLHNERKDFKILVVDADDLQNSLYKIRYEELENAKELDPQAEEKCYQLIRMDSKELANNLEVLKEEYDLIFIDLPGNLKQDGVVSVYFFLDVLLIPTQTSKLDLDSTADFLNFYTKTVVSKRESLGFKTKYSLFFNRVNEQNKDFKEIYNNREKLGLPIMENFITESIPTFQRRVSTMYKYESASKDLKKFIDEFLTFVN